VSLRCEMRIGALSLEAAVVDISVGGIGTLVYDSRVRIEPGTVVERARIVHPTRPAIPVELEVRHVSQVTDADGRTANRAGCVLRGSRGDLEELVQLFINRMGEKQ